MDNIVFVVDIRDKRNQYLMQSLIADGYIAEEYVQGMRYIDAAKTYIYIFAPSTVIDKKIADSIVKGGIVFCLDLDDEYQKYFDSIDVKVYKIFDDETLAMQNAYLTAEGTLAYIIENTNISIKNHNILVLGYGRVGKTVTRLLKDNEVNVYVAVRSEKDMAAASVVADYVCNLENAKKHLPYFSAIVNTIPSKVIGMEELSLINKDCFIIDLASKPGGLDHKMAEELGIKTMHALGIPGKIAPKTAAEYLQASVYKKINEILTKG